MENMKEKFKKIERQIEIGRKNGYSVKSLLKEKVRILKINYEKLSNAIEEGSLKPIAPIFARELAFLNNIKNIQNELNLPTVETDKEIENIYNQMREKGLDWILKNSPQKS